MVHFMHHFTNAVAYNYILNV